MLLRESYGSVEIVSVDVEALLTRLRELARQLRRNHAEVDSVSLFGSFATSAYTPESDIDLLVVVDETDRPLPERADPYRGVFLELPFDVNLTVRTRDEIERARKEGTGFLAGVLEDALTLGPD